LGLLGTAPSVRQYIENGTTLLVTAGNY
jgi:hypothetical protein